MMAAKISSIMIQNPRPGPSLIAIDGVFFKMKIKQADLVRRLAVFSIVGRGSSDLGRLCTGGGCVVRVEGFDGLVPRLKSPASRMDAQAT